MTEKTPSRPSDDPPRTGSYGGDMPAHTPVRSRRGIGQLISVFIFSLIVAATLAGGGTVILNRAYTEPGPLTADSSVVVPHGASGRAIGALLEDAGITADRRLLPLVLRFFAADRPLLAGEYSFPAGASLLSVVAKLQAGETLVRRVTVAEGLTTGEVLDLIVGTDGLTGTVPPVSSVPEGALLPETYHFSLGDTRADLIARMVVARNAKLAHFWAERKAGLPFKTPEEALVLASIVERETALQDERARVAGVFINRLNRGMRLQSDPTVSYGLRENGSPLGRPLRRSDLKIDHPYNTYVHRGLPPGPIANPGAASIAAVLDPAETDDLYFVADGAGGHAFAHTLAEHNRNVARWRRIQHEKPILTAPRFSDRAAP